ncbi:tumor necrosis factor receptor superfamily member 4 [Ahaetulla prasina]|uniref:tumor necrosis factor receptor superfamily member 4 n=1 Tax=Ahaetulla prasina TaxID=499056 RepID=UPI002649AA69|nr:tumor necrosis factor receptor superfamily member 4 [Ahaetulla prasina]
MKRSLGWISLAASLWSSLGWGLTCSDNEYPLSKRKCCKYCPAGEQLAKRCTETSPTECEPCDENYYNDAYTYSQCKPCTDCHADRGLREIRPCQATSNTVCACLPGHAPEESQEEKRCKPCPSGYFSLGGNEKCRPWTNCTASGRKILQSGKQDADTICDKPSSKIPTRRTVTRPTPFPKETAAITRKLDPPPIVVPKTGFVWILITVVPLLTVAGILVFLFFYCRTKKKKLDILCTEIYNVPCKDKENDYRMPIQEQEVSVKSDFVQG